MTNGQAKGTRKHSKWNEEQFPTRSTQRLCNKRRRRDGKRQCQDPR